MGSVTRRLAAMIAVVLGANQREIWSPGRKDFNAVGYANRLESEESHQGLEAKSPFGLYGCKHETGNLPQTTHARDMAVWRLKIPP